MSVRGEGDQGVLIDEALPYMVQVGEACRVRARELSVHALSSYVLEDPNSGKSFERNMQRLKLAVLWPGDMLFTRCIVEVTNEALHRPHVSAEDAAKQIVGQLHDEREQWFVGEGWFVPPMAVDLAVR